MKQKENIEERLQQALQEVYLPDEEARRRCADMPEMADLMSLREALLRERELRRRTARHRLRLRLVLATGVAALLALALALPAWLHTAPAASEQSVRIFAAAAEDGRVHLQTDGREERWLEDSVLHLQARPHQTAQPAEEQLYQTLTTPRGKDFLLVLADGTRVRLNAGSRLRYPVSFVGPQRRVELEGEACFEVTKNQTSPFVVCADGMDVRVLGTTFNVRSYATADRHVTLLQGKVEVYDTARRTTVALQPGEDLTYTPAGEACVSRVNVSRYTAWTEGMFYFEDAPLEEIVQALGRWYNVNIDFERDNLRHLKLNFWAGRNAGMAETLRLLNRLNKVQAIYEDDTITIRII